MDATVSGLTAGGMARKSASRLDQLPARIWGKTVPELWASYLGEHQVQLILPGSTATIDPEGIYLLCDCKHVMDIDIAKALEVFLRSNREFAWIRLRDDRIAGYREKYVTDHFSGRLLRIERLYNSPRARSYRLALTRSAEVAALWQSAVETSQFNEAYLTETNESKRGVIRVQGIPFDLSDEEDVTQFMVQLISLWKNPGKTIAGIGSDRAGVWSMDPAAVPESARIAGNIWVGTDRYVDEGECLIGPAVLWDRKLSNGTRPARRLPAATNAVLSGDDRQRGATSGLRKGNLRRPIYDITKRTFDIVFAVIALTLTLPFYPIIALLIYLEDGLPIFFGHARETKGGRAFACMKFRSMRRDAEEIRRRILEQNMCDGPQFFIDRDPRLTRVGKIIRDLQVDEWPQFFHVLTGKMSVVGPRPLPEPENQYCPAWRDARLSVRPGITGLWQVKRKRLPGLDFQEWIKYDIEYVENRSMGLDLWIIMQSILMLFRLGWSVVSGNRPRRPSAISGAAERPAV
jgi:lipopolysaccharide/colanic/teichoic acid biosynthesis glycosyltransferase